MKTTLRVAAGFALIAFGIAGLVLPVIPGIPLLIAGLAVLGPQHPLTRSLSERLDRWRRKQRGGESDGRQSLPD